MHVASLRLSHSRTMSLPAERNHNTVYGIDTMTLRLGMARPSNPANGNPKPFPALSVESSTVYLIWDEADFPYSSDRCAHTGRYHDLEAPQFQLALEA
ncbi:hypothetical protein N7537_004556 [Penicillium hordei]|uniref:Uncharacterized protein n=1 Tax=Penicillium hordei TaxID=40994 RepID=A0AAD6EBM7_9EURO|nr:uncharacterized protein N7537_004556 [Penicillium hordei]KAJ5607937.1 hypothetical protein N7537_004556 [Penicillium hordei]